MTELTPEDVTEIERMRAHFPYRKITAVKTPDGKCEIFANPTYAQANNYARKTGGTVYRME